MRPNEEKADLEAPAPGNRDVRFCAKCFTMLEAGAEFCPECGAPIDNDPAHLAGSDATIYPELARANLFRMRGEYKSAEDVCRAILRRYPNNATAAGLLGDICAERGELEDAARWYELALDTVPNSEAETRKLESVRRRLKEREALSTVEQLGLPKSRPQTGLYAVLLLVFVFAFGIATFLLGRQMGDEKNRKPGANVNMPFEANTGLPSQPAQTNDSDPPETEKRPSSELLAALQTRSSEGSRLVDAWIDPRDRTLHLTFTVGENDNTRELAAGLALAALQHVTDAERASVRAIRDGKEVFLANAVRAATIAAAESKLYDGNPTGFADAVLVQEWPARAQPPGGSEEGATPDPSSGGPSSSPGGESSPSGTG